jgi:putative heme transporter
MPPMSQDPEEAMPDAEPADTQQDPAHAPSRRPWRILVRVVLVVLAVVISFVVLGATFDDLDPASIWAALRSLGDAEVLALGAMWVVWLSCQGLQTAALVESLPVRRGVLAFLGPMAVASVVPGPSDLPVRYRMFTSWGYSPLAAGLAISAGGIFSIGVKLVLPVVAAIGLLVSGAPLDGTMRTLVTAAVVIGVGLTAVTVVVGSERRTAAAGRVLHPIWAFTARLLRRGDTEHLADRLVDVRAQSLAILHGRWLMATWGTFLSSVTNLSLLVMALRFMDVPAEALGWPQVFVVYALVQGLTVIPITAGNAGVSEVAYISLLVAAAGQPFVNQVAAGVILYRLLTWIVIIPIGLGGLGVWQIGMRRTSSSDPGVTDPRTSDPGREARRL